MEEALVKVKTHKNLINVYRQNLCTNRKFDRINQAFTYGIKLKNGQPDERKLYENLAKVVKSHEQLGLTKDESLAILQQWKHNKQELDEFEYDCGKIDKDSLEEQYA